MSAIATLSVPVQENCLRTQSKAKIENNIFDFLDGEDYISKMVVGASYNLAFEIALINVNYVKVHRKSRKLKMITYAKRLTEVENKHWAKDKKDELQIRLLHNGKTRDLIISRN